jgi:hypothetical protein
MPSVKTSPTAKIVSLPWLLGILDKRWQRATDKLQLTEQNLGRVCNSRSGNVHAVQLHFSETEQPNLKLKTRPKQR